MEPRNQGFSNKSLITLLIVFMGISLCGQISISPPISVTDGDDGFGNKSPRLALNGSGEPMVFWMRTGNEAFFISTKTESGFTEPILIPFGTIDPNLWSGGLGPNIAAFGDDVYVTFEVYGDAIYVTHSGNAGVTWDPPVPAFVPPQGRRATIPVIAVDTDGQPYVAYVNTNTSEGDAHYGMVRSNDNGLSYLPEVDVSAASAGEEVCECCNGHIAIAENGDVYVAFRNNDSNLRDIWMARSTDGGNSFSNAYDLDETDWMSGVCPSNGPHFTITEDEVVTAFYSGSTSSGSGVYFSTLNSTTNTVGPTTDVELSDASSSNQNRPRVAGNSDTLAIVWQEQYNGSTEIAITVSTAGVSGLNVETQRLTELPSSQQFPDILFANGSFHVVYQDSESGTVMYQEVYIGSVGIDEDQESDFFRLGPNPCTDLLRIKNNGAPLDLHVFNPMGQLVHAESITSTETTIAIDSWSPGLYLVEANSGKELRVKTIVIER